MKDRFDLRGAAGRLLSAAASALLSAGATAADGGSTVAARMDAPGDIRLTRGKAVVAADGPDGAKVLRFDGPFEGRIDLTAKGIDPAKYDLMKIAIRADRAAVLQLSLENHPRPGDKSYWWVLDSLRGEFGWRTIWVDLRVIEDIKARGDRRAAWREGMDGDGKRRGLLLKGSIKDTGRTAQADARSIWIGPIRFLRKAVDLDWDQAQAPCTWAAGKDLTFTYPLKLTNKLDKPVTAKLNLVPFEVRQAVATLSEDTVTLTAGQSKTVRASVTLPAAVAASKPPLYCERFEARARAEGIEDSEVTILRSSDPIHLTVTVPVAEAKMQFPLLPRPRELPAHIVAFDEAMARRLAEARPADALIRTAMARGIYTYGPDGSDRPTAPFRQALIAAAYLHDLTGEAKYLTLATKLLAALPSIWEQHYAEWSARPYRVIGSGIVTKWGSGSHYTLSLGWRVGGTQRAPYQYGHDHNARGGGMSGIMYAFDMLAPKLDAATRRDIIKGFFVPAGIQCRNHYIGDGNQQATADTVALYAGLAARNWPLVSFAYSSEHGLRSIMEWSFTERGVHIRKGYQTYVLRPMLWMMELLYGRGINVYRDRRERLNQLVGHGFGDRYFWDWAVKNRR